MGIAYFCRPGLGAEDVGQVGGKEFGLQQEGVVAFLRVHRNTGAGHPSPLQNTRHLLLVLRVEADVGIYAEDQVFLVAASGEKLVNVRRAGLGQKVEAEPEVGDAHEAVGVEALDELAALVQHVGFERTRHRIP